MDRESLAGKMLWTEKVGEVTKYGPRKWEKLQVFD